MKIKNEAPANYRKSFGNIEEDKIINQALALVESRLKTKGFLVTSADLVKLWISQQDWPKDIEQFGIMHLDTKHRLLDFEILFSGTIDAAQVYPREVVKSCLAHNSAAVILVHNHPSGDTEPSKCDIALTEKLKRFLEIIEVRVFDHFIVGDDVYSFAEHRLL